MLPSVSSLHKVLQVLADARPPSPAPGGGGGGNIGRTRNQTLLICTADGNAAVTGAFAALAEYFSSKQSKQSDCGLNLGAFCVGSHSCRTTPSH